MLSRVAVSEILFLPFFSKIKWVVLLRDRKCHKLALILWLENVKWSVHITFVSLFFSTDGQAKLSGWNGVHVKI